AGNGSADDFAKVDVAGKVAVVTRSNAVSSSERAANAAAAGAGMLVVVNDADGELSEWVGADDGTSVGIPVTSISGVEGRALLNEMANKAVTLAAVGVPYSDVIYDIAGFSDGEIPSDLPYAPTKLAKVDTTFYGQKEDLGEYRSDFLPGLE